MIRDPIARHVAALRIGAPAASDLPISCQVVSAASDCTEVMIYGAIGADPWSDSVAAREVVEQLQGIVTGRILARINSFGGSVTDGLAICNALRVHPADVTTRIEGAAYSAASMIAVAGGDRVEMFDNALLMIHAPWAWAAGNALELREQADVLDTYARAMVACYAEATGDEAAVSSWLTDGADHYFTAEEAAQLGLVDAVISGDEAVDGQARAQIDRAVATADQYALGEGASHQLDQVLRMRNAQQQAQVGQILASARRGHAHLAPRAAANLAPRAGDQIPAATPAKTRSKSTMDYRDIAGRLGISVAASDTDEAVRAAVLKHLRLAADASEGAVAMAMADAVAQQADARAQAAVEADRQAEAQRREAVRAVFAPFASRQRVAELQQQIMDDRTVTVEAAQSQLLAHLGQGSEPVQGAHISAGRDERDGFREGVEAFLRHRAGDRSEAVAQAMQGNEFRGLTLREIARASLTRANVSASGRAMDVVGMALTHTSSDFPRILENIANNQLLRGFNEVVEAFPQYTHQGELSDFKPSARSGLGPFQSLEKIGEGGEYQYGTVGDRGEPIQLVTFGKLFGLSRQLIINDDLGALMDAPRKVGQAARRTIGIEVVRHLTSNPVMRDGEQLFSAAHNNLLSGAAITTASVDAMRAKMATQKLADDGDIIPVQLARLVTPSALGGRARSVANSEFEVGATNTNSRAVNYVRGSFEVVEEPRLDAVSAAAWYGFADPAQFDCIEVAYLDGVSEPYVEQKEGWTRDGIELKGRIDFAVKALESITMARNPGA